MYLITSDTKILHSPWIIAFTNNFLFGGHPNDSLIIKVIDRIMGSCIKIAWCKNHDNILFGQGENASTIHFLYGGHSNGTQFDCENSQKSSRGYT